jgi:hypothetical protein
MKFRTVIPLLLLFIATVGSAQERAPKSLGVYELLSREDVLADLALSPEVRAKLDEFAKTRKEQEMAAYRTSTSSKDTLYKLDQARQAYITAADGVLTDEHRKRLQQIRIQLAGYPVVAEPAIAEALGLTKEQRDKLIAIEEARRAESKQLLDSIKSKKFSASEALKNYQKKCGELDQRIEALLTPEQRAKLDELRGPPLKKL